MGGDHAGCVLRLEARHIPEVENLLVMMSDERAKMEEVLCVEEFYPNHNGGNLIFGPHDNYLYIGLGDGGSQGDPLFRAQTPQSPLGKILRIDVSRLVVSKMERSAPPTPYEIPRDNPYAVREGKGIFGTIYPMYARQAMIARFNANDPQGNRRLSERHLIPSPAMLNDLREVDVRGLQSPLPEIYAWGLRNPWGISFVPAGMTRPGPPGGLIVADGGEERTEEVNIIPPVKRASRVTFASTRKLNAKANLGWPWFEGDLTTDHHTASRPPGKSAWHLRKRLLYPWFYYHHSKDFHIAGNSPQVLTGEAIIGGYVYTGKRSPKLYGAYIFGDISGWFAAVIDHAGGGSFFKERSDDRTILLAEGKLPGGHMLRAFGQTLDGEVYALSHDESKDTGGGSIWQIQWDS